MAASDVYPRLAWRELSDSVQVGSDAGRVAILYTVDAGECWEFCCLLADAPEQDDEVLFGVAESTGVWWDNRWERGRRACDYVYADYRGSK